MPYSDAYSHKKALVLPLEEEAVQGFVLSLLSNSGDITVDPGYTSVPTEGTEEYSETIPEEEPVGGDDTWSTLPEEESPDFIPDEVPTEPTRV